MTEKKQENMKKVESYTTPMSFSIGLTLVGVRMRVIAIPTALFRGIEWFYGSDGSIVNDTRSSAQRTSA